MGARAGIPELRGKRVLVTGGTGFVGRHLLAFLSESGAEITCLTRAASRTQGLPPGVRLIRGDLLSGQGLEEALDGQYAVIHLAALLFGLGWQDYLRGNALAADRLGRALGRKGEVERLVLVSSLAATGPSAVSPGVEDHTPPAPASAYGWSKFMAEQVLARHAGERMVALRPPIIYGSGDQGLLPYFRAARMGLVPTPGWRRSFPVSVIHVHDVVRAVLCCLNPAAAGVYHCNDGAEHDMTGIGLAMAKAMGRKARAVGLPLPLMGAAAVLCAPFGHVLARLGRRAPSWNVDKYREARQPGWLCAGGRIRRELGFAPTVPLAEGLREAVRGYRAAGML